MGDIVSKQLGPGLDIQARYRLARPTLVLTQQIETWRFLSLPKYLGRNIERLPLTQLAAYAPIQMQKRQLAHCIGA